MRHRLQAINDSRLSPRAVATDDSMTEPPGRHQPAGHAVPFPSISKGAAGDQGLRIMSSAPRARGSDAWHAPASRFGPDYIPTILSKSPTSSTSAWWLNPSFVPRAATICLGRRRCASKPTTAAGFIHRCWNRCTRRALLDGLTHGFVLDELSRKMSNCYNTTTLKVIGKGADILRLWVVGSDYSEDLPIGPEQHHADLYRRAAQHPAFLWAAGRFQPGGARRPRRHAGNRSAGPARLWELNAIP